MLSQIWIHRLSPLRHPNQASPWALCRFLHFQSVWKYPRWKDLLGRGGKACPKQNQKAERLSQRHILLSSTTEVWFYHFWHRQEPPSPQKAHKLNTSQGSLQAMPNCTAKLWSREGFWKMSLQKHGATTEEHKPCKWSLPGFVQVLAKSLK